MSTIERARMKGVLALVALAALLLAAYGAQALHGAAMVDEYIYLAGARHFAETGRLDARFYDADAILSHGHPHQDVHTPGYVIVLGACIALFRGGYWTAVALNVAAYVVGALLVRALARALGYGPRTAWIAGAAYLVLPAYLAYVYWAMAEVVLGFFVLLTLWLAARHGAHLGGAALTALAAGSTMIVRESVLFIVPAILVLLRGWRQRLVFLAVGGLFTVAVYAPLSRHRAPGGANFWAPTGGDAFGFEAVQAASRGLVGRTLERLLHRTADNARELMKPETPWTERGFLAMSFLLAAASLAGWKSFDRRQRLYVAALLAAWIALVLVLFGVYVVVRWSGFRYMMFLTPAFLPPALASVESARTALGRYGFAALLGASGLLLEQATLSIVNPFKASRLQRAERLAEYLERRIDVRQARRIVLPKGFSFGYKHYPLEVITSLPSGGGGQLRVLERQLDYEYLLLPGGHELSAEYRARQRYQLLNADEAEPPFEIYRRRK
jgi:hypothetical protein